MISPLFKSNLLTQPSISVVIPVYNGAHWLPSLIPALLAQSVASACEFIFIDSGSGDNSVEIIQQFPVKLLVIPQHEFDHGGTRNLGVSEARGKYVVMTVQDALPADDMWIEKLMQGFVNEHVAGVCGIQIVPWREDYNPVSWYRPVSAGETVVYGFENIEEFNELPAPEKSRICSWDNVTAIYKRSVLLEIPFRKISFGEDAAWALDCLRGGYQVAYLPDAKVYHYHHETPGYAFRRYFSVMYVKYKLFGFRYSIPDFGTSEKLKLVYRLIKNNRIGWFAKWKWYKYNHMLKTQFKAALTLFNEQLRLGDFALDMTYERTCKTAPLAPSPAINEKA
ncbi:MAG: glycosyltransferase family 2 protein [Chitinophagaceae bacterium]|nr:MAG: glycosyltransferase family 2 protein [Chitinophagaceae bacterium]